MKVILSRKGFDSQYGGQPSPILPDGTLLSLPIPQDQDNHSFGDLIHNGITYEQIILELKPGNKFMLNKAKAHLDPDLRRDVCTRPNKIWRSIFGQSGAAQTHLKNQSVAIGDLFLFFGWFRQTEIFNGRLRYVRKSPHLHILFGYLQIDEIYALPGRHPEYLLHHPHANEIHKNLKTNCMYVAKDRLTFNETLDGWGTFELKNNLVLTKAGYSRGRWELPEFFKELTISHHTRDSFRNGYFQTVDIGQEFVIQGDERLTLWAKGLIEENKL